jgi:pimeloyl-ACP methyl ester carboxylesterase
MKPAGRLEPTEAFIEVPGGRLHYLDWGGGGPQAHFLHGNGFCAGTYAPFIQHLIPDLHVIASDARGHGGSDFAGIQPIRNWRIFEALSGRTLLAYLTADSFPAITLICLANPD